MESSVSYLIEPLLTQFFLIDAICTGYLDESQRRGIFAELSRVFCVPENQQTQQYYLTANIFVSFNYNFNVVSIVSKEVYCL